MHVCRRKYRKVEASKKERKVVVSHTEVLAAYPGKMPPAEEEAIHLILTLHHFKQSAVLWPPLSLWHNLHDYITI